MSTKAQAVLEDLLGIITEGKEAEGPLPEPWGVLYVEPTANGDRRNCDNCVLWAKSEERCIIHARTQKVTAKQVCGYHVFGTPMEKWMDLPGIQAVNPKFSGLNGEIPSGTSCDTCRYYEKISDEKGLCHAVVASMKTRQVAPVQARGCCSRWMEKEKGK